MPDRREERGSERENTDGETERWGRERLSSYSQDARE